MAEKDDALPSPLSHGLADLRQNAAVNLLDASTILPISDPQVQHDAICWGEPTETAVTCHPAESGLMEQDDRWSLQLSIWRASAS